MGGAGVPLGTGLHFRKPRPWFLSHAQSKYSDASWVESGHLTRFVLLKGCPKNREVNTENKATEPLLTNICVFGLSRNRKLWRR